MAKFDLKFELEMIAMWLQVNSSILCRKMDIKGKVEKP